MGVIYRGKWLCNDYIACLLLFSGIVWEVQFNTLAFIVAKEQVGHKTYKTMRYVHEMVLFHAINNSNRRLKRFLDRLWR